MHEREIRLIHPELDDRLLGAFTYCASTLNALHSWSNVRTFDVVSYSFSLATLWHLPDRITRSPDILDPMLRQQIEAQALEKVMDAQKEAGHWRFGTPVYSLSQRHHVYPYPPELLYVLFERIPDLLSANRMEADLVLSPAVLAGLLLFCECAERERFPLAAARCQLEDRFRPRGWAASNKLGVEEPECWVTAVVLRAAKAVKQAVVAAADKAARAVLQPPREGVIPWRDLRLNRRVLDFLQVSQTGEPVETTKAAKSAILAGPPGTGKTTLVHSYAEAVANAKYVYITPQMLTAEGGVDKIGSKLEQVFALLDLLDGGVVLFDEIDEIVLERDHIADESSSRLLTTAMLPRFQRLWEQDKISFFVATNHIEKLDAAIRREGRFDQVVAVELPDRRARELAFLDGLKKAILKDQGVKRQLLLEERDLLQRLFGPIKAGGSDDPWITTLRGLMEHDGLDRHLPNALSDLHQEVTAYAAMLKRIVVSLEMVRKTDRADQIPELEPELTEVIRPYIEAHGAAVRLQQSIYVAWHCSAPVSSLSTKERRESRYRNAHALFARWTQMASKMPDASKERFEVVETGRCCLQIIASLLRPNQQPCSDADWLDRNLEHCLTRLADAERFEAPARSFAKKAIVLLQELRSQECPKLGDAAAFLSPDAHLKELLQKARDSLLLLLQGFPHVTDELGKARRAVESLCDELAAFRGEPPASPSDRLLDLAIGEFHKALDSANVDLWRARREWWPFLSAEPETKSLARLLPAISRKQVEDLLRWSAAEAKRHTRALLLLCDELDWLALAVEQRGASGPASCAPRGFILMSGQADDVISDLLDDEDGDKDQRKPLLDELTNMPADTLAERTASHLGDLEVLHPIEPPRPLIDWVWQFSRINANLASSISRVFAQLWPDEVTVPVREIPWPLPRSGQKLRVGEFLTRKELETAAERVVGQMGLNARNGLAGYYSCRPGRRHLAGYARECAPTHWDKRGYPSYTAGSPSPGECGDSRGRRECGRCVRACQPRDTESRRHLRSVDGMAQGPVA